MQQMQMDVQMSKIQAETQLAQARAVADEGLGVERLSRVDENRALGEERRAKAVADQDQGLLNLVKALKEIENVDLAQLEKLITLSHVVKDRQETIVDNNVVRGTDY